MTSKTRTPTAQSSPLSSVSGGRHYDPPSRTELRALGKHLREKCPRQAHAEWKRPDDHPHPLALLEQSNRGRIPELLPIRHGRMLQSPFAYYRGFLHGVRGSDRAGS